jgi:non-homologous end joining protein Ku
MSHSATAKAPNRSSNSITLAFGGLINIPLSVFSGTEETRVARREFVRDTEVQVGRANIRKDDGHIIDVENVVRKAQATNGVWVEFNDAEVAAATSPKGLAEVVCFVPVKSAGQYLAEDVVQLRPKSTKGKVDPNAAKSYALFLAVLRKLRAHALIKLALRGPARYGLLTADGDLIFVYTADAIRQPRELDEFKFSAKELNLGVALAESIGIDAPVLSDDTAEAVQKAVDIKAAGKPAPTPSEPVGTVGDLEALLRASIKGEAA